MVGSWRSGTLTYDVPAKVNLTLYVVGRRADGYHELRSVMAPIGLFDRLTIRAKPASRTSVTCAVTGPERVPGGKDNLAARAALRLLDAAGISARVELAVHKRIPVGAGLGGGSSDAATVLRGLQAIVGLRMGRAKMVALAASIGADVPFFLGCRPSWAAGIGEQLTALTGFPDMHLVVAIPQARISTVWAFRNALGSLTSGKKAPSLANLSLRRLAQGQGLHNDFEAGIRRTQAEVVRVFDTLEDLGARATVLSGTGSAVVGVFASAAEADQASRQFRRPDKAFAVGILRRAPAPSS